MSHPEYTEEQDDGFDWGYEAQKVAEAHLGACMESMFAEQEGEEAASPASAPFDGCDTCITREVLHAAYPVLERGWEDERRRSAARS